MCRSVTCCLSFARNPECSKNMKIFRFLIHFNSFAGRKNSETVPRTLCSNSPLSDTARSCGLIRRYDEYYEQTKKCIYTQTTLGTHTDTLNFSNTDMEPYIKHIRNFLMFCKLLPGYDTEKVPSKPFNMRKTSKIEQIPYNILNTKTSVGPSDWCKNTKPFKLSYNDTRKEALLCIKYNER